MKIKTALISAFYKEGIAQFVRELISLGVETIYGSKGTIKNLVDSGVTGAQLIDVATIVGEPILGHRVVTLSRQVHAALLALYVEADMEELKKLGLPPVDLVCVDMYPLKPTVNDSTKTLRDVLENMDIGGPTMLSSGSKGQRVMIGDKDDRQKVIDWMKDGQPNEAEFIESLAAKADFLVSQYRMLSATYRSHGKHVGIFGTRILECKYGENAYQTPAALFSSETDDLLALDKFRVIEGTAASYNNWVEIDRQLQTITHIAAGYSINRNIVPLIAVGTKHGNACGAAVGNSGIDVLQKMISGDPLAIFGGLVITNFVIGEEEANVLSGKMLDGITAPGFTEGAIEKLKRKGDKCRFIVNDSLLSLSVESLDVAPRFRYVRGGFIRQPNYTFVPNFKQNGFETFGTVSSQELEDMCLAWAIGATSNSNTITIVKNNKLLGNGTGQQDRVGAAGLAVSRARRSGHELFGAAAYSDSFFPFPDGPKVLLDAGITAILTSSGSRNDHETIKICAERNAGLLMIPDAVGRGFFGY
jgi:phosphoribosylaminoimidazolecarboxamide formyltransferase/IMP cyclohydrolase